MRYVLPVFLLPLMLMLAACSPRADGPLLKGKPDMLVVLLRSAGSGGYLSADAFELAKDRLQWRASVEGLSVDADPLEALRKKLAAKP